MRTKVLWEEAMTFIGNTRDLTSRYDTPAEFDGHNSAPTPKEAVLNAMCACSGMDVVSFASKMRFSFSKFWMEAEAQKTKTTPSYFASVHVKYFFEGTEEREKIIKVVDLSMKKYCGVTLMITKVCPVTYDITVNGALIHSDKAQFDTEA